MEIEFIMPGEKATTKSILDDLESISSFGGVTQSKGKIKLGEDKPKKKKEKKDKSEKKKKNKGSSTSSLDFSLIGSGDDSDGGVSIDLDLDLERAIDEIFDEDGNPIIDPIINEQKNGYNKRKKDKNPYKQEFAEEMTLLYNLYSDVSDLTKDLEKTVKSSQGSKVRGTSKTFNETLSNLISARTTQLQIIKEMSSVKKTTVDLKMKDEAKKSKETEGQNGSMLASSYLQQIMNGGRNNFLQRVRGTTKPGFLVDSYNNNGDDDSDSDTGTIMDFDGVTPGYTDDEELNMNDFLLQRIEDEGNPFRSEDGDKLIQYEKRGVKVCVKKDSSTGDWEFIALDRDDQIVHDYPLPRHPGKIKFAGPNAIDRYGVTYRVIEYDSAAFDDNDDY